MLSNADRRTTDKTNATPPTLPATHLSTCNFTCRGCGASMSYDASAQTLRCPFCGSEQLDKEAGREGNCARRRGAVCRFARSGGRDDAPVARPRLLAAGRLGDASRGREDDAGLRSVLGVRCRTRTPIGPPTAAKRRRARGQLVSGRRRSRRAIFRLARRRERCADRRGNGVAAVRSISRPPCRRTKSICRTSPSSDSPCRGNMRGRWPGRDWNRCEAEACQQYVPGKCRNLKVNVRITNLASRPMLAAGLDHGLPLPRSGVSVSGQRPNRQIGRAGAGFVSQNRRSGGDSSGCRRSDIVFGCFSLAVGCHREGHWDRCLMAAV